MSDRPTRLVALVMSERYPVRVSLANPDPVVVRPGLVTGPVKRRPPVSVVERDRRRRWGLQWAQVARDAANQLRKV